MLHYKIIFLFFLSFIFNNFALADLGNTKLTKFEWGAGFLNIYGNHYRGSNEAKAWIFPTPYFTYKSDRIEADPSFIRGIFYHNEWVSLKLSLMLGLNVESKSNKAREGMPSLDFTIEAGPMFIFHLWEAKQKDIIINFECPIRQSFATNLRYLKPVGLFTIPYINLIHSPTPATFNWSSEFSLGPMFANQSFHQYFYNVDKQFTRGDRPYYQARGGYSGFQTTWILNKRISNFVIIPFIRWDYLKHASFEDSPLVKIKNYTIGGLALYWLFK